MVTLVMLHQWNTHTELHLYWWCRDKRLGKLVSMISITSSHQIRFTWILKLRENQFSVKWNGGNLLRIENLTNVLIFWYSHSTPFDLMRRGNYISKWLWRLMWWWWVVMISDQWVMWASPQYYPSIMDIMPATILHHHGLGIHVEIFISLNTIQLLLLLSLRPGHILQTINNVQD